MKKNGLLRMLCEAWAVGLMIAACLWNPADAIYAIRVVVFVAGLFAALVGALSICHRVWEFLDKR